MLLLDSLFQRRCSKHFGKLIGVVKAAVSEGLKLLDLSGMASEDRDEVAALPFFRARLRSRLLSHLSIAKTIENDTVGANKCLSEAAAELSMYSSVHLGGSWARVLWHQAEVAIQSAYAETEGGMPEGRLFSSYCREVRKMAIMGKPPEELREMIAGAEKWRRVLAKLRDVSVALEQAEAALVTRRRNVWWTTCLFQRRLALIEMELWVTAKERGRPIPVLGLEYAPRGTNTLADEMLDNTQRMVRLDSYRLAAAVQAYAYSALAFRVRLELDNAVERMSERQEDMKKRLTRALEHLREVHSARNGPKTAGDLPLSESVNRYVYDVIQTAESILKRVNAILY